MNRSVHKATAGSAAPRKRTGPKNRGPASLRLCRVLDELRAAYPGSILLPVLAARHRVSTAQIRRDLDTLTFGYAVARDWRNSQRGRLSFAWALNPTASLEGARPARALRTTARQPAVRPEAA